MSTPHRCTTYDDNYKIIILLVLKRHQGHEYEEENKRVASSSLEALSASAGIMKQEKEYKSTFASDRYTDITRDQNFHVLRYGGVDLQQTPLGTGDTALSLSALLC